MNKKTILFLALLLTLSLNWACWAQEPNIPTTELKISGLRDKVTIRRDERGIPYIEARNEADLYFAQGYVTAHDRLWQMDLYRRVARGETSEIFGNMVLEEDKRWRKFGFASVAEETVKALPADTRATLENYARGVNAFIAAIDEKTLPIEFRILQYRPREWRPADSIVIGKILADALSTTWQLDLQRAALNALPADKREWLLNKTTKEDVLLVGKDVTAAANSNLEFEISNFEFPNSIFAALEKEVKIRENSLARIGFHAEELAASNNWVVSGKRTADGKPLLANDPHLRAQQPAIWYLVNLSASELRVAGVTVPGAPGVILGHNDKIAWGATNVGPDVQDLYLETFNAEGKYKTPAGWETPIVRREEIKVRKNPLSTETESTFLDVTTTRNGVIFFEESGKRYALRWTAFDPKNDELSSFNALNRAKNWNDFKSALKTYGGPMQNFVFADTAGNIGWYAAGRVPKRKTGDGSAPYDGGTDDGAWTGMIPFEELPQLYNPPEGIIVTANQRIVGQSYPHQEIVRAYDSPYRARRIYELLSANPKLTVDNFRDVHYDTFSIPLTRFAREIVNLKAASDETLKLLAGWDGRLTADSKAALVANEIRFVFRQKIFAANLGAQGSNYRGLMETALLDRLITEKPKSWLPKEYADYAAFLKDADAEAQKSLTSRLRTDSAKWNLGEANKIRFQHPLAAAPLIGSQFAIDALPQNGGRDVPNVGASVSMRLIATPGNWDLTRQVITTGESGNPMSPHWKDQLDAWYKGNTPVFPFTEPAVKAAARGQLTLSPQN
ncbi:MAG: penicillin acylase family protein [Acidobacteriota bacterium]|nr:penicillin acylase family protein [Acidobacteriota bacterium]